MLTSWCYICSCDVATREEAAAGLQGQACLGGILHAGGILDDALLIRQTPDHVRRVYAPKACGGANLLQVRKAHLCCSLNLQG